MKNIKVVELGKYTMPKLHENKQSNWVEFGDNNSYYDTLLEAKDSATNSALINGISNMIYGKGISATDASRRPEQYAAMISLFGEDTMRMICSDYYTLGQAAFQIIYNGDHSKIVQVEHIPIQHLAPEKCNDEDVIEAYYYSDNWADITQGSEPTRIPSFGTSKEGLEILVVKPYKSGFYYFSPVEYQSGIDYAFVEIELSKFHLNNIHNRFSANMIINFNNGVPEPEEQTLIEGKIKSKYTGSEGEGIVVSFNDDNTKAATIETPQLNDAHNQYQFIAEEAARKLMVSHKVTSPLLFGLTANGGLGSNADEIKMASLLFDNTVIKPMQRVILEAVNKILAFNDVSLNTFFVTSQPLDFTEMSIESVASDEIQEQTGVESGDVSVEPSVVTDDLLQKEASYNGAQIASALEIMEAVSLGALTEDQAVTFLIQMLQFDPTVARALFTGNAGSIIMNMRSKVKKTDNDTGDKDQDFDDDEMLNALMGEYVDDEWEFVDGREVSEDNESIEDWAAKSIELKKTTIQKLADIITSKPSRESQLDKSVYKVRYSYEEKYSSGNSRKFCSAMTRRNQNGVVYRLEDIDKATRAGVNKSFGHKGQPYDLFKYKGGVQCGHFWQENLYRLKKKTNGEYVEDKALSSSEEVASIPKSYQPTPRGSKEAKIVPRDMPNSGHHPSYKKK